MFRHVQPRAVPESAAPFSQVAVDDLYAHFAGLVAADFAEGKAVLGDVGAETGAILTALTQMLNELDLDLACVVRTDVHLTDLDDFNAMDDAYRHFFQPDVFLPALPPSRAVCLLVAR